VLHKSPRRRKPAQSKESSTRLVSLPERRKASRPHILLFDKVEQAEADSLIFGYLDALDSPRALTVWLLYSSGSHRDLVELTIDPLQYNDAEKFRLDYAATKFLSKCVGLKTGIDLEGVAIASANDAELRCRKANEGLRELLSFPGVNPALQARLFACQQKIAAILGPLPTSLTDAGWSPGRTSASFGDEVASIWKYTSRLDVTLSAWGDGFRLLQDSPLWGAAVLNADGPVSVLPRTFSIVEGNTMITVPKSAKTDRVICYEPHVNIRLQLAVGSYIRHRLKRVGVDLNDQSINQRRALEGSLSGDLATIDLSMASDTLSAELVFQLVPIDWAVKLDRLRSRYTLWPDGSTRLNEKFSSMGNGFTFELESLIFYALASTVTENVSVFGDDIILPTEAYGEVSDLLVACGFSVNERKSFATSYFRESCGCDAFGGLDCTPVYLRRLPKSTEDVVKLHNGVRAWCARGANPLRKYHDLLLKWRHIHTCLLGPSGYGDGHYHVDFDQLSPKRAGFGLDGWWFKTYTRVSRVNRLYGDRVSGRFSDGLSWGALCTAIGPKRLREYNGVVDASVDRRQWFYKPTRVLANFIWPGIVWV